MVEEPYLKEAEQYPQLFRGVFLIGGIMFYWRIRAGIKNPNIDKEVIPECIVCLVSAEDANEAIIKVMNEFPQYNLFITSIQLANDE